MSYSKTLLAVAALTLLSFLQAAANSVEDFDYADGSLAGANGGSGWADAWANGFSRNGGDWTVASGAAFSPNDGTRFLRSLDTTYSSGVVYVDVTMQVSGVEDNPFAALELFGDLAGVDGNRYFSFGILRSNELGVADQGDLALRDYYATGEDGASAGQTTLGEALLGDFNVSTNRLIARLDLDNDLANVFFNPSASTDLVNGVGDGGEFALATNTSFGVVGLANFGDQTNPNSVLFDDLFIGTTAPIVVDAPSPALAGDVNDDGTVDLDDFNLIRTNFRTVADFSNFMTGDISGPSGARDQFVDFFDFIEWSTAFESAGGSLAGLNLNFLQVPEPSAAVLLISLLAGSGCAARRRGDK